MKKCSRYDFGRTISARRRELDLTQEDVSRLSGASVEHIAQLENAKRIPSNRVLSRLALVLRFDTQELLLQVRPKLTEFLNPEAGKSRITAWEAFTRDKALRRRHSITAREMQFLSRVSHLGEVKEPRDFVFILIAIRLAIVDRHADAIR